MDDEQILIFEEMQQAIECYKLVIKNQRDVILELRAQLALRKEVDEREQLGISSPWVGPVTCRTDMGQDC